jgi:hypothetical protein
MANGKGEEAAGMRYQIVGGTLALLALAIAAYGVALADPPGPIIETGPRLAMPSETKGNVGYHVGGGNPFPHLAEPRRPDEGTWGWDYQGWWLPRRILNGWWHERRYQGGTGAYKSDGRKFYP